MSTVSFCCSASSRPGRIALRNSLIDVESRASILARGGIVMQSYWMALFCGRNHVVCVFAWTTSEHACTATWFSLRFSSKFGSLYVR